MRKGMEQLCLTIPKEWFGQLDRIARNRAAKKDREVTRLDLIREAIAKKHGLEYPKEK